MQKTFGKKFGEHINYILHTNDPRPQAHMCYYEAHYSENQVNSII